MPALVLAVAGIALPDSLNPTLIVAAIYLGLGPRPFARTLAFTVAAFTVTLAGGLLIAVGLGDVIVALLPKPSATVKWTVLTIVGVALVCGAGLLWHRRDSVASDPPSQREAAKTGTGSGSALLMGGGIAGLELLTAFPYFGAIALVLGASVSLPSKVLLLVLYNVIYALPLVAIVVVTAVLGERGAKRLAPIGDWIATRWPVVVAPLLGVAGFGLVTYGIVRLV